MFLILVYDVNVKRTSKVLKKCRKYLRWVQNSVLEGEITKAQFEKLRMELKSIIDEGEDSIIFYEFRTKSYSKIENMGIKKGGEATFI